MAPAPEDDGGSGVHPVPAGGANDEHDRPGLSRWEVLFCLGVSLAVFLLYQGPFWRHRWQLDGSIWYSYLVIPIVVAIVLVRARKLDLRQFALGTIEVTCWKFGATYLFAHALWMFSPPPPRPIVETPPLPDAPPQPVARKASSHETGSLEGRVTDVAGRSVAGVVAFVESGVEGYELPRVPTNPAFSVGAGSVSPALLVAELHEEIHARSSDGKLHTLIASQGDTDLFNLPLQSSGAVSATKLERGQGVANLRCTVHERSAEVGRLVVVSHPFHALLDESGRFAWSGIPAGRIAIAALGPDGRTARIEQEIGAGRSTSVTLALP